MSSKYFNEYEKLVETSNVQEATLFKCRVYLNGEGELIFEYESMDPQDLRKSILKETDGVGAWRIVDRLKACSDAIMKDWEVMMT